MRFRRSSDPTAFVMLWWLSFLACSNNPYAWNNGTLPPGFPFPRELDSNMYTASQLDSGLNIQTTPVRTWQKRTDFWGLFGFLQTEPQYTVRSMVSNIKRSNSSFIMVGLPTVSIEQNPFGLIAVYFFGYNMKRKISKTYGSWRRESLTKEDAHPTSRDENGLASSRASTFADFHRLGQSPSPPSPHWTKSSTLSSKGVDSDAQEDDIHLDPWTRQERHNQVTEAKFKELDGLLREYYLNMGLVDTRDSRANLPWYKKLFSSRLVRCLDRRNVRASEIRGRESMETYRMVDV
ncbi:hypothetical protein BGZ72_004841 [Mortierella alpina]|nr:hypothetical protein BGZ72_004841 [Mortierella alpina]